jgi:hypothetical protein
LRRYAAFLLFAAVLIAGAFVRLSRLPHEDPRWYTLSSLARELAAEKQTYDVVVASLGGGANAFGLISDEQKAFLRLVFSQGKYELLDREPQLTLRTLGQGLDALAERRKAAPVQEAKAPPEHRSEALGLPTGKPGLSGEPFLKDVGLGLKWGDRLDVQKAARAADSQRLADVLEGVALGVLDVDGFDMARFPASFVDTLVAQGHQVRVLDQRLAANFGDLERKGRPVATPLWVATGRTLDDGEPLLLPVPHAQLVLQVRGPKVNADVTFYPSLDLAGDGSGGARFRADVTTDQRWTGGWIAHTYERAEAQRALGLMLQMRRGLDEKVRAKGLPLDGYFSLGVCTLAPAVVEQALSGRTTLWPLTHDPKYFDTDSELDVLVRALPVDGRDDKVPDNARLKGALPWRSFRDVPFPLLARQLRALRLLEDGS